MSGLSHEHVGFERPMRAAALMSHPEQGTYVVVCLTHSIADMIVRTCNNAPDASRWEGWTASHVPTVRGDGKASVLEAMMADHSAPVGRVLAELADRDLDVLGPE